MRRLYVRCSCSDLCGVYFSDIVEVICSYERVKSDYQSKPRLQSLHHVITHLRVNKELTQSPLKT
jgi:hypothetical protein